MKNEILLANGWEEKQKLVLTTCNCIWNRVCSKVIINQTFQSVYIYVLYFNKRFKSLTSISVG